MNKNKYVEKAVDNFINGFNCSQAVLLAFKDDLELDENTLAMISSSFGGGMGRLREVCGAVSAMFMVAGLKYGYSDPKCTNEKKDHYKTIQLLAENFKKENGTIICRDLLEGLNTDNGNVPSERTEQYYKTRPCAKFVADAAAIMYDYIKENEMNKSFS